MPVEDRHEGNQVFARAEIRNLAVTIPTIGTVTVSAQEYTVPITMSSGGGNLNDSSGTFMVWYHLDDTAGVLATEITGASGAAAGIRVFPDVGTSGVTAQPFATGRVLSNSTGDLGMVITSTGTSTARLFLTLMNGSLVTGSTLIFT